MGHDEGTRESYLVEALLQLEEQARQAELDRKWPAATLAKKAAARVRADLDQWRETQARQAVPTDRQIHKSELLAEVRRLRVGAAGAGSYVAASRLIELEHRFVSLLAAEEAAAALDVLSSQDADAIRAEIERLTGQARSIAH